MERNVRRRARQYGMSQLHKNLTVFLSVFLFVSVFVYVAVLMSVFFICAFIYILMQRNVIPGARRQYVMSQLHENPTVRICICLFIQIFI